MEKQKRDAEEMGDAMKSLENRTLDSKREMDILAALDEMKSMKVLSIVNEFYLIKYPLNSERNGIQGSNSFCNCRPVARDNHHVV